MWAKKWFIILIFLVACGTTGQVVLEDIEDAPEMASESAEISELYVEPAKVEQQVYEFAGKLASAGKNRRPIYEEYIDIIGANGILDGIEKLSPKCHSEAHDLGKIIYARLKDIGKSLRVCADRCYTGCMHGVLMEAFAGVPVDEEGHVDVNALKPLMNDICFKNEQMIADYSPGECAHGIGHALMVLSGYIIPEAIELCNGYANPAMAYYCASGAYMEYVIVHDPEDAKSKSLFYPCDTYDYPGACFWHKMLPVMTRNYKENRTLDELRGDCEQLSGKFRLGCFHGLGNAHMSKIYRGKISIKEVCLHGTEEEQFVCIEGSIERMARYFEDRAVQICDQLEGKHKEVCLGAVKNKMNNVEKDLTLYLAG